MKVFWQYIEALKITKTIYQSLHFFLQEDAVLTLTFCFKINLTFVVGLKQKSCKNSENLLELMICLKNKTYYTLMNKSV